MAARPQPRLLTFLETLSESSQTRVITAVCLLLVGYLALFSFFMNTHNEALYEARRQEIQRLVEMGLNTLEPVRERQRRGEISVDEARAEARDLVRRMHFTSEGGDTSFFLGTFTDQPIVLTPESGTEDAAPPERLDPDGRRFVQALVREAMNGHGRGFVEQAAPGAGGGDPENRVAYVVGIPEWGYYLGTSFSPDAIRESNQAFARISLLLTSVLFVLVLLVIYFALRSSFRSYRALIRLFDQVTRDPDRPPAVPVEEFRTGSEEWQLLRGFQTMIERIGRSQQEVAEANQTLEQRVAERTRELATLLEVAHNVSSTLVLELLLPLILSQLKSVVDFQSATVFRLHEGDLVAVEHQGPQPRENVVGRRSSPRHSDLATRVIAGRQPIIVDDLQRETRGAGSLAADGHPDGEVVAPERACLGAPLAIKERVIGMIALRHSEAGFYTARHADLVLAIAQQAAIAIENATLYERAQEAAALEERQRLARELHDSVSQALYGIALGARTARTQLDRDPARAVEPVEYVLALAEAGLVEMRALIFELRPESLETEGIVAALAKQAASLRARHGLIVDESLGEEPEVGIEVKQALYRIAQEALHNTVKHARATRVRLSLAAGDEAITLEVADDGSGFDPGGHYPGHFGLQSMRERAARIDGDLAIVSAPGAGTRIQVTVPRRVAG
ncbi:MAG TPA: histidine kinase, partial [Dehalococcoidia bacterium]|nr:histidine kinase [Dehalococcoidia bacterium]